MLKDVSEDEDYKKIRIQLTEYLKNPTASRRSRISRSVSAIEKEGKRQTEENVRFFLELIKDLTQTPEDKILLTYWVNRLHGGFLHIREYDRVVCGKWYDSQILSAPLPLRNNPVNGFEVDLSVLGRKHREKWSARGFHAAVPLPLTQSTCASLNYLIVRVPPSCTWRDLAKHGYAAPVELQWERQTVEPHWTQRSQQPPPGLDREDRPGLYVTRSIIEFGFWKSYQWWPGCELYFYRHHPEWFRDDPIFGGDDGDDGDAEFVPPGAAVISPSSLSNFRRLNVTG